MGPFSDFHQPPDSDFAHDRNDVHIEPNVFDYRQLAECITSGGTNFYHWGWPNGGDTGTWH
jgi:hypothetical protein